MSGPRTIERVFKTDVNGLRLAKFLAANFMGRRTCSLGIRQTSESFAKKGCPLKVRQIKTFQAKLYSKFTIVVEFLNKQMTIAELD